MGIQRTQRQGRASSLRKGSKNGLRGHLKCPSFPEVFGASGCTWKPLMLDDALLSGGVCGIEELCVEDVSPGGAGAPATPSQVVKKKRTSSGSTQFAETEKGAEALQRKRLRAAEQTNGVVEATEERTSGCQLPEVVAESDAEMVAQGDASEDIAAVPVYRKEVEYEEKAIQRLRKKMNQWVTLSPDSPPFLLDALDKARFTAPTPIQSAVLPEAILRRRDVVAAAETGSGKTLAFGIPVVTNIYHAICARRAKNPGAFVPFFEALVLVPSRELATQVHRHIERIVEGSPISVACIIGGMSGHKQIRVLDTTRPQIVVATPGRLCALSGGYKEKPSDMDQRCSEFLVDMSRIRYLVIDEADRLTEAGHFAELSVILRHLYAQVPQEGRLQTFIFSATLVLQDARTGKTQSLSSHRKKPCSVSRGNGYPVLKDFGQLTERMRLLLEKIRLRPKSLFTADLTGSAGIQGSEKTATDAFDEGKKEGGKNGVTSLKLPANLSFSVLRCLEKDSEFQLYLYLSRHFHEASGASKALVFVNSITYVYRLEPLLALLFGTHQLYRQKNLLVAGDINMTDPSVTGGKSENSVKSQLKGASEASTSHGVALLSSLLGSSRASQAIDANNSATACNFTMMNDVGLITSTKTHTQARPERPQKKTSKKFSLRREPSEDSEAPVYVYGIHSQLKQSQRLKRMERFQRPNEHSILVCTDVAARGLDLPNVDLVIHCQPPRSSALFVHRSGRTARAMRAGACVALCTPSDVRKWQSTLHEIGRHIDATPEPALLSTLVSRDITRLKQRFVAAEALERSYHQLVKGVKESNWLYRAAKEADVALEEEWDDPFEEISSTKVTTNGFQLAEWMGLCQMSVSFCVGLVIYGCRMAQWR